MPDGLPGFLAPTGPGPHALLVEERVTVVPSTPYSWAVLDLVPALYWRLDETGGTVAVDASGNHNHGTYIASPALGQPGGLIGDSDLAVLLDGATEYVVSDYTPYVNGSQRTFTGLALRVSDASAGVVFGSDAAGSYVRLTVVTSGTDVLFDPNATGGGAGVTWPNAWPGLGVWVHWALAFDEAADTVELFINGVSQGVLAQTDSYSAPGSFKAGARGTGASGAFNGYLDEIAVFERLLTAAEVQTLAATALGAVLQPLTVGGATAQGVAPSAAAPVALGGAVGQGQPPSAAAPSPASGVNGGGTPPAAQTAVPLGGVVLAGLSPAAQAAVAAGGVLLGGVPPSVARAPALPGGVVVGGVPPGGTAQVTPAPGGAAVGGRSPTGATVPLLPGGAQAQGVGPSARSPVAPGGAVVQGASPAGAQVPLSPAEVDAGGRPASALAPASLGGVVVGGRTPGEFAQDTAPPGGVAASGNGAAAIAAQQIGGVVVGGRPVGESNFDTATPGGVEASGVGPPGASSAAAAGGVQAGGPEPATRAPAEGGGASAGGRGVDAAARATPGGVVAGGPPPGAEATALVLPGGVVISGRPPIVAVPLPSAIVRVGTHSPTTPHFTIGPTPSRPFGEPRRAVRAPERSKVRS